MKIHIDIKQVVLIGAAGWANLAHASLGGDLNSVSADATALNGIVRSEATAGLLAVRVDNGIQVREWLDAGGTVYAIAWTGPAPPDLSQLLGRSYSLYTAAVGALPASNRRRGVHIHTAQLVVDAEGYLRAYSGRAYLADRLPPGVTPADIR